jgi:hypothetical protein
MVLRERNILLGNDIDQSLAYVEATRACLIANYLAAMNLIEGIERQAFGDHSYFVNHGQRSPSLEISISGASEFYSESFEDSDMELSD